MKTYPSPGASWVEGVGSAGEDAVVVDEQHSDEVVTICRDLTFVLTNVHRPILRRPWNHFQGLQIAKGQPQQVIPLRRIEIGK